ncbi:MAG: SDR family NAD(P)-dependent oxidoreductase [Actinomycetota bacterium]|nr:SDR family NAD(P)-dependent oxidoreductase [Actinomycetota bacterium]
MLQDRVAIVTGAGRGLGRAHALRLAAYGARVLVNDAGVATDGASTDEDPAAEVVAEIIAAGGEAVALRGDVADEATANELVAHALDSWHRLDIVVNNAGFGRPRMAFNMSAEEWDDVVRVHLRGTFVVSRPACRYWRAQAKEHGSTYGRLINTSTGLLVYGGSGQSNYVAAKAGVSAFTEAIASEMAPYGVTANVLMPGANTRLAAIGWRSGREDPADSVGTQRDPVHVAEFVCYLASPDADWISGQTFQMRGGRLEHVRSWAVDHELRRDEGSWTAAEFAAALPREFGGAGPKRAEMPPADWKKPGP